MEAKTTFQSCHFSLSLLELDKFILPHVWHHAVTLRQKSSLFEPKLQARTTAIEGAALAGLHCSSVKSSTMSPLNPDAAGGYSCTMGGANKHTWTALQQDRHSTPYIRKLSAHAAQIIGFIRQIVAQRHGLKEKDRPQLHNTSTPD